MAFVLVAALLAVTPAAASAAAGQPQVVEPATGAPAPSVQDPGTLPQVTTAPAPQASAAPARAPRSDGRNWALIVVVVIAASILALVLVLVAGYRRGWDPPGLRRWRHAIAEAGYRVSLGWAELRDLLRLGR
ncbi:MAG: hypothetical protein F2796_07580 [Actinobacteria bacterium]|nr:hypothetical protein [Actinomycetota bacterium]